MCRMCYSHLNLKFSPHYHVVLTSVSGEEQVTSGECKWSYSYNEIYTISSKYIPILPLYVLHMYISLTSRLCETPVRKHQSEMGRQQFVENSFINFNN